VGQFTVPVDTGHYDEVEFEIHKASPSDDVAFVAANLTCRPEHPGDRQPMAGAFTFYSDLDGAGDRPGAPARRGRGGRADLTLLVNLDRWFRTETGDLIDPASANKGETNEGVVKNNIQNALEAFEDEDQDGAED
jgi:hypothetical protein